MLNKILQDKDFDKLQQSSESRVKYGIINNDIFQSNDSLCKFNNEIYYGNHFHIIIRNRLNLLPTLHEYVVEKTVADLFKLWGIEAPDVHCYFNGYGFCKLSRTIKNYTLWDKLGWDDIKNKPFTQHAKIAVASYFLGETDMHNKQYGIVKCTGNNLFIKIDNGLSLNPFGLKVYSLENPMCLIYLQALPATYPLSSFTMDKIPYHIIKEASYQKEKCAMLRVIAETPFSEIKKIVDSNFEILNIKFLDSYFLKVRHNLSLDSETASIAEMENYQKEARLILSTPITDVKPEHRMYHKQIILDLLEERLSKLKNLVFSINKLNMIKLKQDCRWFYLYNKKVNFSKKKPDFKIKKFHFEQFDWRENLPIKLEKKIKKIKGNKL